MIYGVIDIGSNSVRLMIAGDKRKTEKFVDITKLGAGLIYGGALDKSAMARTQTAILNFVEIAKKKYNVDKLFLFATEAVRTATNAQDFVDFLSARGINVDVLTGEQEAECGFYGAYTDGNCCVVDIGGASSEIAIGDEKGLVYSCSVPIGVRRINTYCGEDVDKIRAYVKNCLQGYGRLPHFDKVLSIGGTSASFVAICEKLDPYDSNVVEGYELTLGQVTNATAMLAKMSAEEKKNVVGLQQKKSDVIVGAGILLGEMMKLLGVDHVTARECDNMEGYLKLTQRETPQK